MLSPEFLESIGLTSQARIIEPVKSFLRGKDDTLAKEVEKELTKRTGRKAEMTAHIGGVVTSNIGPDLVAVLIRRKNK